MGTTSASRRWDEIGVLFDEALDRPREEREDWLVQACEGDRKLFREVERMLAAHDRTAGILERSLDGLTPPTGASEGAEPMTVLEGRIRDRQVGPYQLVREIGRGGMAVVYQARDPRLDRFVALKFLPPPLRAKPDVERRFFVEAKAASALDHPNICTIYDIGEAEGGQLFIAMAYYEGETLAQKLAEGPLAVEEAIDLAVQVAEGLARSHEAGIIHRDVKPSNIMVTERGVAKLLDFGIAKLEGTKLTRPGTIVGTVVYMSPEQLHGSRVDHRTDVWSFGAVLYETLTGVRAFAGDHPVAVLHAILHDEPPPPRELRPEVPEAVERMVTKMLAKSPGERYGSAAEVAAELRALRQSLAPATLPHALESAGNLPPPLPGFVGRERQIAQVRTLLARVRLVTLTGPAGTGKTRLAIETARGMSAATASEASGGPTEEHFPDGVFFVDLSPISDPELVPSAVLHALGLGEPVARDVLETLKEALKPHEALLILDNFEQVVGAAEAVAGLLAEAPRLKVLVTSRVVLRLSEEYAYPVPPLELPKVDGTIEELSEVAAVELFCERARAADPGFRLTAGNAAAVAEICIHLDGMPLAIELAAARIRLFPPEALLKRLGQRLDLLKTGARDRPERHRTLRQAIAWSYDLLSPAEQAFFRRLSIFVGGTTLEAAEAIAAAAELPIDALDGVTSLIDQSLLRQQETGEAREGVETGDEEPRFVMLETMLEFGREALVTAGEWEAVRRAHAEYFYALAEKAAPQLTGPRRGDWLVRLDAEHENFRAALTWAEEEGEADLVLAMTAALGSHSA